MAGQQNKNTDTNLEQFEAKLTEMLAKAQESADEIVKNAKAQAEAILAKAQENTNPKKAVPVKNTEDEEYVQVRLDKVKGQPDVFVAVNGENCQVQRGQVVKIKKKFFKVLQNSKQQDEDTMSMIEGLTSDYEDKKDNLV